MWIKEFGEIKKNACLFTKSVYKALCFVFLFMCDNLLLQKCAQSLCENTVILCVNLIDPINSHKIHWLHKIETIEEWKYIIWFQLKVHDLQPLHPTNNNNFKQYEPSSKFKPSYHRSGQSHHQLHSGGRVYYSSSAASYRTGYYGNQQAGNTAGSAASSYRYYRSSSASRNTETEDNSGKDQANERGSVKQTA
jgi:hypothetical protein